MKTVRWKTILRKVSPALAVLALLKAPGAHAQAQAGPDAAQKIEPWVIENTRAGAQAEFFVVLKQQADLLTKVQSLTCDP